MLGQDKTNIISNPLQQDKNKVIWINKIIIICWNKAYLLKTNHKQHTDIATLNHTPSQVHYTECKNQQNAWLKQQPNPIEVTHYIWKIVSFAIQNIRAYTCIGIARMLFRNSRRLVVLDVSIHSTANSSGFDYPVICWSNL